MQTIALIIKLGNFQHHFVSSNDRTYIYNCVSETLDKSEEFSNRFILLVAITFDWSVKCRIFWLRQHNEHILVKKLEKLNNHSSTIKTQVKFKCTA